MWKCGREHWLAFDAAEGWQRRVAFEEAIADLDVEDGLLVRLKCPRGSACHSRRSHGRGTGL